ncbi:phage protein NinX family protein [Klebsiella quasipneumoniae]|uniref:phage protein NinX family protein n=1 Tax=Klebsiella quasipneumoniae TaxID=1463165 RepID=UPI00344C3149
MDYSKLSDFEINKRVAKIYGGFALTLAVHKEPPSGKSFDPGRFDPCNNPADAFPIIEANRISLRNRYEGDWKAENEWGESHFHVACNPLRAAMVVFLMMQGDK